MEFLKNVPNIGELTTERVLFMFDKTPIVFVCIDKKNSRYLCMCTDSILEYTWLLAPIGIDVLLALMNDEISIVQAFEKSNGKILLINQQKDEFQYTEYDFNEIPEDELPDRDEKLENPNLTEYLMKLYFVKSMDIMIESSYEFENINLNNDFIRKYKFKKVQKKPYSYIPCWIWDGKIEQEEIDVADYTLFCNKQLNKSAPIVPNVVFKYSESNSGMNTKAYSLSKRASDSGQMLMVARG